MSLLNVNSHVHICTPLHNNVLLHLSIHCVHGSTYCFTTMQLVDHISALIYTYIHVYCTYKHPCMLFYTNRCMQEELRILNAQDKLRHDSFTAAHSGYQATPLHEHDTDSSALKRLKSLLKPFYDKYDVNGNGTLDIDELHAVFKVEACPAEYQHLLALFL